MQKAYNASIANITYRLSPKIISIIARRYDFMSRQERAHLIQHIARMIRTLFSPLTGRQQRLFT